MLLLMPFLMSNPSTKPIDFSTVQCPGHCNRSLPRFKFTSLPRYRGNQVRCIVGHPQLSYCKVALPSSINFRQCNCSCARPGLTWFNNCDGTCAFQMATFDVKSEVLRLPLPCLSHRCVLLHNFPILQFGGPTCRSPCILPGHETENKCVRGSIALLNGCDTKNTIWQTKATMMFLPSKCDYCNRIYNSPFVFHSTWESWPDWNLQAWLARHRFSTIDPGTCRHVHWIGGI